MVCLIAKTAYSHDISRNNALCIVSADIMAFTVQFCLHSEL